MSTRVTPDHDRMGGDRVHAEQPEQRHAGGVIADADAHQCTEDEIGEDRDDEAPAAQPHGGAGRGSTPTAVFARKPAAISSAMPMTSWMLRRGMRLTTLVRRPAAQL